MPRPESYRRMVFISLDRTIEGLVPYLAHAGEYLDLMLEFGGEDVAIVHGPQA